MGDTDKTVFGKTIEVEGEIEGGDEELVVQGTIRGKITCQKDLTVDASGKVEATVTTRNLAIAGKVKGNVEASGKVELHNDGVMIGDIKCPRVILADGSKFKGHIQTLTEEE